MGWNVEAEFNPTSAPASVPQEAGTTPATPRKAKPTWVAGLVTFCSLMVVLAVCVEGYRRATNYGRKVVEAHPVEARIEIANSPAYLDRRIVDSLLTEAYQFAAKDEATYNRVRNTLDGEILRNFADLYTGSDGGTTSRQAAGYNAWIKRVTQVRRDIAADRSIQTIRIFVEWREPAVWARSGDLLYLLDAQGTRLPGDYHLEDRGRSKLMVISGVDLPAASGTVAVPAPGEKWTTDKNGTLGVDLLAGMQLAERLRKQQFASQIDAVDMANYAGRKDSTAPWIVLDTVWETADMSGKLQRHVVEWGRPIGEEKYYEVQADMKIKALNELNQRFNRIDAGRSYVDIRTEVLRLAKLAMATP
jgi:hypothetical protein